MPTTNWGAGDEIAARRPEEHAFLSEHAGLPDLIWHVTARDAAGFPWGGRLTWPRIARRSTIARSATGAASSFSGGSAFLVDAGINTALIHLAGLNPFISRLISIGCAMVFAWLMHRRVTFAVAAPPSLGEFARFAAVAGSANALNYAIYAAILLAWPATLAVRRAGGEHRPSPRAASYLGFRFGVFRRGDS